MGLSAETRPGHWIPSHGPLAGASRLLSPSLLSPQSTVHSAWGQHPALCSLHQALVAPGSDATQLGTKRETASPPCCEGDSWSDLNHSSSSVSYTLYLYSCNLCPSSIPIPVNYCHSRRVSGILKNGPSY